MRSLREELIVPDWKEAEIERVRRMQVPRPQTAAPLAQFECLLRVVYSLAGGSVSATGGRSQNGCQRAAQ